MSVNDETWDKCRFCKETIKTFHGNYHDDGGCQKYSSWHEYNNRFSVLPPTDFPKLIKEFEEKIAERAKLKESSVRDPAKVEALIQAALKMPRGTPAPGGCGTDHQYTLKAYQVWALDAALIALGFPYVKDNHVE